MNEFLILRLRNAAIDMDNRGNNNLAHLLTEAIAAFDALAIDRLAASDALETENARLRRSEAALEQLRPVWAQGYSSDSSAAQSTAAALSFFWLHLSAENQTQAVEKFRSLVSQAAQDADDLEALRHDLDRYIKIASAEATLADARQLIIDEVHAWAVCAAITTPEDMAQNFAHIAEITAPQSDEVKE